MQKMKGKAKNLFLQHLGKGRRMYLYMADRCRRHHVQINAQPLTALCFLLSQLRKAVMDHISDSFLETNVPLLVLIEAAKSGNEKEVKEYAQVFREHANKLVEVRRQCSSTLPWQECGKTAKWCVKKVTCAANIYIIHLPWSNALSGTCIKIVAYALQLQTFRVYPEPLCTVKIVELSSIVTMFALNS